MLETKAAKIMLQTLENFKPKSEIALETTERDIVQQFSVRHKMPTSQRPIVHKRYSSETVDGYVEGDKQQIKEYMRLKASTKLIEVWLDNVRAFLEIEMDINSGWKDNKLSKLAYPPDAQVCLLRSK